MTDESGWVLVSKKELRALARKRGRRQMELLMALLRRSQTYDELVTTVVRAGGNAQGMFGRVRAGAVVEALRGDDTLDQMERTIDEGVARSAARERA